MHKRVRDLLIGDCFYVPAWELRALGTELPVELVTKEVKTGAWYLLGVRWTEATPESDVWYLNPKPLGTHKVRMLNASPVARD